MRLDGIGKPTILRVVPEPKENGSSEIQLGHDQVKSVLDSPEGSLFSSSQNKAQIIDLLIRTKKDSKKKKKDPKSIIKAIGEYRRIEDNFQQEWRLGQKLKGENIDVRG